MSRRAKILLVIWGSLLALIAFLVHRPEPEPSYQGKTLTYWTCAYRPGGTNQGEIQARDAIRQMGGTAIPHLLKWIKHPRRPARPAWLTGFILTIQNAGKLFDPAGRWFTNENTAQFRAESAAKAFSALEPKDTEATIPELTRLVYIDAENANGDNLVPARAMEALSRLEKFGRAATFAACTSTNPFVRRNAVFNLGQFLENPDTIQMTIPVLVRALADDNPWVSYAALYQVGSRQLEPKVFVPILTAWLSRNNGAERCGAVRAIGQYGVAARPAVPNLLNALNDPALLVRTEVTNALHAIDPMTFPNKAFASFE